MQEEFKNTNGVIRTHKSKDRQHNDQQKKDKSPNNCIQNTTQETKDRATRTPLKTSGELSCSGSESSFYSTYIPKIKYIMYNVISFFIITLIAMLHVSVRVIVFSATFMSFHRVCGQINMTGTTSGAGTVYLSGAPEFTPGFQWGSCYSIFSFICMFCRSLFVLLYFS